MIHLFIADDPKLKSIYGSLAFDEELHGFIYKNADEFPTEFRMLSDLSFEGEVRIFSKDDIEVLCSCSEEIILKNHYARKVLDFMLGLKMLCEKALDLNKKIIAVGD